MAKESFQFTRIEGGKKNRTTDLGALIGSKKLNKETWLFVSPHDDDLCLGAGLLMQAAVKAGVDVQALIVTDGNQGYCTLEQRDKIVEIRLAETLKSFEILGISQRKLHHLGYPDGGLAAFQGRRHALGLETSIANYVGLQNAFTYYLRQVRPDRVFVPTPTDYHPDHQITNNELMISLYHAGGAIWPELGKPIKSVPMTYELAVYCDFAEVPNIEIRASDEIFEKKLKSIAAYQSQAQIEMAVNAIRKAGAYEYIREVGFKLYSPEHYKARFA